MNTMELFELLGIESAEDFKYFDNMADLLELEEDISYEAIHELIAEVSPEILDEVISDYFKDISEGVPETETEIYLLLENICNLMRGLAKNEEDEMHMAKLADEIYRFRNWYNMDTDVICQKNKTGERKILSVRDALILHREEKLSSEEYSYDFSSCCDYEIDEYVFMNYTTEANADYDWSTGNEEKALLESDFIYDDDMDYSYQ